MARRRSRVPLDVHLNGRLVGRLERQVSGAIEFRYDPTWLDWDNALPVSLSLPLREDRYLGAPVFNVFDNLLPDNDAVRRRIAGHAGAEGADAYSLLSAIGRDCVGALQFLPNGEDPGPAGIIEAAPVDDDEVARILHDLAGAPLGLGEDREFRISIAGAQEKTALLRHEGAWYRPHGTTATTHILKPQIGRLPNGVDLSRSVENEFFCLRLTQALGLPSAAVEIADFGNTRTLVVERFDRFWARDGRLLRRPQEDCCQALSIPPTAKYQAEGGPGIVDLLHLLQGSDAPEQDRGLLLKAQLVFWLFAATDGHAKNFSVFLLPGGRFRLTPLYDVLSLQPAADAGHVQRKDLKLAMSVGDGNHYRVNDIVPRHFIETVARAGIASGPVEAIFHDLVVAAPAAIDRVTASLPVDFSKAISDSISEGVLRRLERLQATM